ncbi:hypothetical protein DFH07DRAFT_775720 [Mycena maculata]|uniref:Uncharacterized protein n=1 Tax=Mycena maculata TaxID=230809 RepID=A0AAD7IS84_9AGAR|nr:hypothetical protein DFH07DRAFT_775720 [Mycena maculata]
MPDRLPRKASRTSGGVKWEQKVRKTLQKVCKSCAKLQLSGPISDHDDLKVPPRIPSQLSDIAYYYASELALSNLRVASDSRALYSRNHGRIGSPNAGAPVCIQTSEILEAGQVQFDLDCPESTEDPEVQHTLALPSIGPIPVELGLETNDSSATETMLALAQKAETTRLLVPQPESRRQRPTYLQFNIYCTEFIEALLDTTLVVFLPESRASFRIFKTQNISSFDVLDLRPEMCAGELLFELWYSFLTFPSSSALGFGRASAHPDTARNFDWLVVELDRLQDVLTREYTIHTDNVRFELRGVGFGV